MWQSHAFLRSETLLMCSQGLCQLAAPILLPWLEGPQHLLGQGTGSLAALGPWPFS